MRLFFIISLLLTFSMMTTFAFAAGFTTEQLGQWPWWEMTLVAFPFIGVTLARVAKDR